MRINWALVITVCALATAVSPMFLPGTVIVHPLELLALTSIVVVAWLSPLRRTRRLRLASR